jgi:hypothetical protein
MATFRISFFGLFFGLCCVQLHAQTKPIKNYKLFFEKVYLHTDRELYAAGNDIWFKAYMVNGQNNLPIGISNNLYVELISPQAEVIKREIVRMDYGIGSGDFRLDSVATGKYRLRAYTNWMRNFGDNFVFEKEINIINADNKRQTENPKPVFTANTNSVRFFPEGGSLIEGVSSLVAIKAEDIKGRGITVSGSIINTTGDTISKFTTDSLGMGLFALMPLKGQRYHAVFNANTKIANVAIAEPLATGLSLAVIERDTLVDVIINTNNVSLSAYNNHSFTITGKHGGVLCLRKPVILNGTQTIMRVPKSFFPDGVTNLLIYDEQNKPYTERLIYVEHPESNTLVNISVDKTGYKARDKVTVRLKLNDSTSKANLSMAVVDESVVPVPVENMNSYLMLTSELKGNIEQPKRYFDTTNVNRHKQLDLLLLTQGWRDFVWKRVADTAIRLSYAAENGFSLSGNVRQKFTKKPVADMNITLTAFKARGQKLFSAKTDSTGHYYISNLQLFGPQLISVTARNNKGNRSGWLLMDSLTKEPMPVIAQANLIADTNILLIKNLNQREEIAIRANTAKLLNEVKITDNKTVVLRDVVAQNFGYPDQVFNISKKDEYYEALDNWLAHNVKGAVLTDATGVKFRGYVGNHSALVYPRFVVNNQDLALPADGSSAIPELAASNANMANTVRDAYFNIPMSKVKKVELKHLVSAGGPNIEDVYVLYLNLTPDAFENKDFGLEKTQVPGYYEARVFYKPLYDIPVDSKHADVRSTIHWEPNIIIHKNQDATASFYNADVKGKMRIVVEGLTDKGVPLSAVYSYQVVDVVN